MKTITKNHYLVRPTVSVVIERNGKLLFIEEREGSRIFYSEPVGHVELHESIVSAAHREIAEETGYSIKLTGLLGLYHNIHHRNDLSDSLRIAFVGKIVGQIPRWKREKNIIPIWIPIPNIKKYWKMVTRPASRRAISDYLADSTSTSLPYLRVIYPKHKGRKK